MDNNNGLKFWKWAVVLLVLCNVGLMLVIWLKPHPPGLPNGEQPRDLVIRTLKFSDDQVKKYDSLINDHQHMMKQLHDETAQYRQRLFENLGKQGQFNTEADSLTRLIADGQRQIEIVTYYHFAQVRALCTDAQKAAFDKIIVEVTKKMNGNGRGGPLPRHPENGSQERRDDGNRPPPPPRDRPGPPENE